MRAAVPQAVANHKYTGDPDSVHPAGGLHPDILKTAEHPRPENYLTVSDVVC